MTKLSTLACCLPGLCGALGGCSSPDVPAASVLGMPRPAIVDGAIGQHRVRVLLDTGSNALAVSASAARRIGLDDAPSTGTVTVQDATGAVADAIPMILIRDLHVGTMRASSSRACLLERGPFGVDVIAGTPFLIRARWLFDGPGKLVRLLPNDDLDAQLSELGYSVRGSAPLAGKRLEPLVRVRLDGRVEALCELDTGSESTYLTHELVRELGLADGKELAEQQAREAERRYEAEVEARGIVVTSVDKRADEGYSTGVLGERTQHALYRLDRLECAGGLVEAIVVRAADENRIGWDVIGRLPWVFDGPANELHVLARK